MSGLNGIDGEPGAQGLPGAEGETGWFMLILPLIVDAQAAFCQTAFYLMVNNNST